MLDRVVQNHLGRQLRAVFDRLVAKRRDPEGVAEKPKVSITKARSESPER